MTTTYICMHQEMLVQATLTMRLVQTKSFLSELILVHSFISKVIQEITQAIITETRESESTIKHHLPHLMSSEA